MRPAHLLWKVSGSHTAALTDKMEDVARDPHNGPELMDLIRRYLHPEHGGVHRYLRLGDSVRRLGPSDRAEFGQALAEAAAQITPRELAILLDDGWRESRTAAWFIAVARRRSIESDSVACCWPAAGPTRLRGTA